MLKAEIESERKATSMKAALRGSRFADNWLLIAFPLCTRPKRMPRTRSLIIDREAMHRQAHKHGHVWRPLDESPRTEAIEEGKGKGTNKKRGRKNMVSA